MFSSYEEPTQSEEGIIFPLCIDTESFDRSFYHPSITANQLSTEEVEDTLSQIDKIYREKEDHIAPTLFCGAFARFYLYYHGIGWRRTPASRGVNALILTSMSLYLWNDNRKAKDKACELLEQANQRIVSKGFRWYFPQSFSQIELYPDYSYDPNQLSGNEDWKTDSQEAGNDDCQGTFSHCPEACLDELDEEDK